ncbi:MAG: hypothetical protein IH931_03340 [candidate division Zixibacteria bacterium]|nr:hypothetical protein [candidate division Zixibacteria bacterium]
MALKWKQDYMINICFKMRLIFLLTLSVLFIGALNLTAGTEFPLKNGDKVRIYTKYKITNLVKGHKTELMQGFVAGFENDILLISNKGDVKLDRVVRTDGSIVEFSYVGAKYDTVSRSLLGIDKNGEVIGIPLIEINYVDVIFDIKRKQVSVKLNSDVLHSRLRYVNSYPELLYKIPIDSITKVKKWKKTNSSVIALAALAGGVAALIYGVQNEEDDEPESLGDFINPSREANIFIDVGLGIVAGGAIGYLIGKSRWSEIPVEKLKIGLQPTSKNGVGLSLTVSF